MKILSHLRTFFNFDFHRRVSGKPHCVTPSLNLCRTKLTLMISLATFGKIKWGANALVKNQRLIFDL